MTSKNYKIIVPVSSTQCLEITTTHCKIPLPKQNDEKPALKVYQSDSDNENKFAEVQPGHADYHKILYLFKSTSKKLMQFRGQNETFMMATNIGFQIVHIDTILYFDYNTTKKMWVAILSDNSCLLLKRSTTAQQILYYSTSFFRINQQHIINLKHLERIDDKQCILSGQLNNTQLIISRTYLKKLQEHFLVI